MPGTKRPHLVAVGGGKGGVGKSLVACNLSVALAELGAAVVLVDADLGGANQHTLFGVTQPGPGLQAFLDHDAGALAEVLVPTGVTDLQLLPGTGAVLGAANINHGQKQRLLRRVRELDADFVVIDVGAGVSFNVLDFFDLGTFKLAVMTPQLTAIQNAYAFLKSAVLRSLRRAAAGPAELALLERSVGRRETEPVREILARIDGESPGFARAVREALGQFRARIVGNECATARDVGVFQAVSRMVEDFLGIHAPALGAIPTGRALHDSVNLRRPMLLVAPHDPAARVFRQMAEGLLREAAGVRPATAPGGAGEPEAAPPSGAPGAQELAPRGPDRVATSHLDGAAAPDEGLSPVVVPPGSGLPGAAEAPAHGAAPPRTR